MTKQSTPKAAVVVLSWNSKSDTMSCLEALKRQSVPCEIVVVENGSTDGSVELLRDYSDITLLEQTKNLGFDGGVNVGITHAMNTGFEYVALLNNDAIADRYWLEQLTHSLEMHPKVGITTCKLLTADGSHIDSTGDLYTTWGLAYPRGRGEVTSDLYDKDVMVLGASGGASLYRISMLRHIGLFDEKFFAYYEDVDISLRAQLAGWKILYTAEAIAYHQISASSSRIKGFATYQTTKNLPMVFWKNIPLTLVPTIFPRLIFAYWMIVFSAFTKGNGLAALKGNLAWLLLIPHTYKERRRIQKLKVVSNEYMWSILTQDLPPNASRLRTLRAHWWRFTRKTS